jgi:nucleoside 2-deoxyribosyltransferase
VTLHTYAADDQRETLEAYAATFNVALQWHQANHTLAFNYTHPLATPIISPREIQRVAPFNVHASNVLRFGMLDGDAIVDGDRVVYDPQSAFNPRPFSENGSTAKTLAVVGNVREVTAIAGTSDAGAACQHLLAHGAAVVVLKQGAFGCVVWTRAGQKRVPAYRSPRVFKIGSGDVFSAAFAHAWAERNLDAADAADLASRAVAAYCSNAQAELAIDGSAAVQVPIKPTTDDPGSRTVYLAGPFFSLAQRWLVEEAREALLGLGTAVFSPLHDVGLGLAEDVAQLDLEGLKGADAALALGDGQDTGTLFEIGWARAKEIPVVILAENEPEAAFKMADGSGCERIDDFTSAVYRAAWAALEKK